MQRLACGILLEDRRDLPVRDDDVGHFLQRRETALGPAGTVFIERLNQIDFRVAKIVRVGRMRTNINFDFFNITNSNSVLTENQTFGAAWRTPQSILLPRLFKLGLQLDF